jgi:hypothetical protein
MSVDEQIDVSSEEQSFQQPPEPQPVSVPPSLDFSALSEPPTLSVVAANLAAAQRLINNVLLAETPGFTLAHAKQLAIHVLVAHDTTVWLLRHQTADPARNSWDALSLIKQLPPGGRIVVERAAT